MNPTLETRNPEPRTMNSMGDENIADIVGEMNRVGTEAIMNGHGIEGLAVCEFAARIIAAAAREAATLIPAVGIDFSDDNGRRTVSEGWVKPMRTREP